MNLHFECPLNFFSFRREIYSDIITLNDTFEEQGNLKDEIDKFKESNKKDKKGKKAATFEMQKGLKGKQKGFNGFESKYFQWKSRHKEKDVHVHDTVK